MRRAVVAILALALQGCAVLLTGAPDTFDDMWQQLDRVAPDDFTLLDQRRSGLRSGFAGSGEPIAENQYSGDWNGGALCDRLRALLEQQGGHVGRSSESCSYQTRISAGWRARLVNVWTYQVEARGVDPSLIRRFTTAEECAAIRKRNEGKETPDHVFHGPEACGALPGQALVIIDLRGKTGW
jgi:hypothetical protein